MTRPRSDVAAHESRRSNAPDRATTLVWIDGRRAVVARQVSGRSVVVAIESNVPGRHRGRPHVRHDPLVRHGGGGDSAEEARKDEQVARFLASVAGQVSPEDDVVVVGPGEIHDHLARQLRERDAHHGLARRVESSASDRLSERQLVTRLRTLNGDRPPRRTRPPAVRSDPDRPWQAGHSRPGSHRRESRAERSEPDRPG